MEVVDPSGDYEPLQDFRKLGVLPALLANAARCGYVVPTPVQQHALPLALGGGRDLLASAQTGSGKTAAFMLPLIAHAAAAGDVKPPKAGETPVAPPCVVLAPTRELAAQIHEEAEKLSWGTGVRTAVVYGGAKARPGKARRAGARAGR